MRLPLSFFLRTDVVQIAQDLLGQILVTEWEGQRTSGIITETEAYRAPDDRACHAYNNRRTPRTEIMFGRGAHAYIYLCYGIHHLFNVVTGPEGMARAVLIRAIEPLEGIEVMRARRMTKQGNIPKDIPLCTGPGAAAQALGLHTRQSGQDMLSADTPIWIEKGSIIQDTASGPRIGVDYAGACADWPWRFWIKGNKFVSKHPKNIIF
jgi:DNA-3-methyladenine glycosylase